MQKFICTFSQLSGPALAVAVWDIQLQTSESEDVLFAHSTVCLLEYTGMMNYMQPSMSGQTPLGHRAPVNGHRTKQRKLTFGVQRDIQKKIPEECET